MPSTAYQTMQEADLFFVVINGSVSTAFNGARRCLFGGGTGLNSAFTAGFQFHSVFNTLGWDS